MSDREGMEKKSLRQGLSERWGEAGAWRGKETVVLHGMTGATVHGCKRIVYYSPSEICLQVASRRVALRGRGLYCASFSAGTVKVEGLLSGVFFVVDGEGDKG